MKVAVTYAEAKQQLVLDIEVKEGCTTEQAIRQSGMLDKFPYIDLAKNKVGIFCKLAPLEQVLQDGDRIEIYRPALGKPPKKERAPRKAVAGAKTPAAKPKTEATAGDPAAKAAAARARVAAAKAKLAAKKTGAAPVADPKAETSAGAGTDDKTAKIAAAKARAAAAKARLAANKKEDSHGDGKAETVPPPAQGESTGEDRTAKIAAAKVRVAAAKAKIAASRQAAGE